MSIKIGISSGIFGIAKERGHEEAMQYAGLPRKAMYSITKGVNFIQLDLESISEFIDPHLEEGIKNAKRLGIEFGIHSETASFGQREFPHLDSAINVDYQRGHDRLITILEGAGRIGSKYLLIHSSESTPFIFLSRELQPTELVDVWGRPLEEFMKEHHDWMYDWLTNDNQGYIWIDLFQDTLEKIIERLVEDRILDQEQSRKYNIMASLSGRDISAEEAKLTPEMIKEITDDTIERYTKYFYEYFTRTIKSKSLHYGPERTAYYLTAKWMERENDPLWKSIIDVTIQYYVKKYNKEKNTKLTVEQWLKLYRIEIPKDGKWTIDDPHFREYYQLWVPSVSAKYVWGHFMQEKCPKYPQHPDPKELLKKHNILFLFETPMAGHGMEDLLRFPQPAQMYYLIKDIASDKMGIAIDLEHLLMDGIDPEIAFEVLPDGCGKYIRVIHTGWPSPLGPAHIPIPIGSEQHQYLYKKLWELKQKGMNSDPKDWVYFIFERGGGEDPVKQSILSLRLIKQFLEKDVPPEKLPLEFYGMEAGQVGSEVRQWAIIEDHGRDPLKGMLILTEEEHGMMGKSALEKGKRPEEYKKEEVRG